MSETPQRWRRQESRPGERRAPIVPEDAARLVDSGVRITVEESPQRVFAIAQYAEAGCLIAAAGSWSEAPGDAYVVGLKELPPTPQDLRHQHIYFGHAYKGQKGARALLERFSAGGGALLDWSTSSTRTAAGSPRSATGTGTSARRSLCSTRRDGSTGRSYRSPEASWTPRCAPRLRGRRRADSPCVPW